MNKYIFIFSLITLFYSCQDGKVNLSGGQMVNDKEALQKAINEAEPGTKIVLANGVWKDVEINFIGYGTEDKPITLSAETPGKVSIEGKSNLKFGGEYLVVDGLHFNNGFTPSGSVITFKINNDTLANHCRMTNCVIEEFNQLRRDRKDHWVEFWGRHNQLDHCYIAGKSNEGPTIRVDIKGNKNINNYHQITNNHFGPRPRKGGPKAETIQIGDSYTSMSPCYTNVSNNLFEKCNGEVEVISSKTNFNEFRNNVFYKCEGSMVTRHGNYCIIDGNYFIGDGTDNIGGVRLINTGHWVTNNYFYNLKGQAFRSPLAIMNGIPKSPLNRYNQVTDAVVAHNTWVNCTSPWHFGVGTNISEKDVLPLSEIRSARPIRTVVANNIIYNEKGDPKPVVAHDQIDGITFKNNLIDNNEMKFDTIDGLKNERFEMKKAGEYLYVPSTDFQMEPYVGFDFESIGKDLFGNDRSKKNMIGSVIPSTANPSVILDKKNYGTSWYSGEAETSTGNTIAVSTATGELDQKIKEAKSGDILALSAGNFEFSTSLIINKKISIQAKDQNGTVQLIYKGLAKTAAFEMHPKGNLILENVKLSGTKTQYGFASLKENMSSLYNLKVSGGEISDFDYVLKAYKESFADEISFSNTTLKNCNNGIELSEETNDKGDYNVEFLKIDNCQFDNIKKNVIDYYRGGYDESTIGGNLILTNSAFTNCGGSEENGILLNTRGIINVDISKNTFKNNSVKLVALLWGAKNNSHSENTITNSGKLIVEENLKLKLVY